MLDDLRVAVNCTTSHETMYVLLKHGSKREAIITSGWSDAVDKFELKENDICTFSFRDERNSPLKDPTCWLRLVIAKLDP
jgi:hypothetical protein